MSLPYRFGEYGFEVFREVFSHTQLQELLVNLNRLIDQYRTKDVGSYINYADSHGKIVNSIHRIEEMNDAYFDSIANSLAIKEIRKSILGSEGIVFSMQAFLKPAGFGRATPPHQDNAYWCHTGHGGITVWCALDRCDKTNGMMEYALRKADVLIPHHSSTSTPGSSLVISDKELRNFEWYQPDLNPGDCVVHHGHSVHRSAANFSPRARRGFLINVRAIDCVRDEVAHSRYLTKLETIYGR